MPPSPGLAAHASAGPAASAREHARAHASLPEPRVDAWRALHETFAREAREAGTAGRPRCRTLFLGDSITEAMRGTQFGEAYDELAARRDEFERWFPLREARAFGISGDRTQHLLHRLRDGELAFRHPPGVAVLCVGTNNLGRDHDSAEDTFLGIRACVLEILQRLPGTRVLLTGILPRGPARGAEMEILPPAPGETDEYAPANGTPARSGSLMNGSGSNASANASANARANARGRGLTAPDGGAPRSGKFAQPGVYSDAIAEVNARLASLARGSEGQVGFVDCSAAFLTDDRSAILPSRMRDALHPSAEGMRRWFEILAPAIEALRELPAPSDSWYAGARPPPESADNGSLASVDASVRLALARLIAWSPHALCVCDVRERDHPIVFANDNFFTQTGYAPEEVIGRNCRFLQGPETDPETVREMRDAIRKGEEFDGKVMNRHKNGAPLVNSLVMSPLRNHKGDATHYIGIQRLASAERLRDAPAEYQFRAAL